MYLCTVPGTGTRYFRKQLPGHGIAHCSEGSVNQAKSEPDVATTYRNPMRTAATWGNSKHAWKLWDDIWYWYGELIKLPHVKVFDFRIKEQHGYVFDGAPRGQFWDKYGLHAALDREDYDYFYQHVPRGLMWLSE